MNLTYSIVDYGNYYRPPSLVPRPGNETRGLLKVMVT